MKYACINVDVPFGRILQQRLRPSPSYCIFSIVTLKPVQIEEQRIQREENDEELLPLPKVTTCACMFFYMLCPLRHFVIWTTTIHGICLY